MENTPSTGKHSSAGLKQLSIPRIPGARMVWSSNSIADAAAKNGITKVQYCDKKRFSILGGVWSTDSITVYGE